MSLMIVGININKADLVGRYSDITTVTWQLALN